MASPPAPANASSEHGFDRPEMYSSSIVGTVNHYEKHVLLCYKDPQSWPSHLETSKDDDFPRLFAASLKARKSDTPKKTRLTITDATESTEGDVLIFPDMARYKALTVADIDKFVEEVLVNESSSFLVDQREILQGSHVFVCAHERRDMRCGVCGPALIDHFNKEIADRGMANDVFVKPCSHVGGHKFAGNVIIYRSDANGETTGHWYGYVTPKDVALLLDEHISKGKIIKKLWRGQMGLPEAEQKKIHEHWCKEDQDVDESREICPCVQVEDKANGPTAGCCKNRPDRKQTVGSWSGFSFFDSWERGDTLAALAVVSAIAAVAVAFSMSWRKL